MEATSPLPKLWCHSAWMYISLILTVTCPITLIQVQQEVFIVPQVKVAQSCLTLCDPMDYTVHEILKARTLQWVAFPFSRGSSQPRNQTPLSHIFCRWILYQLGHKGSPLSNKLYVILPEGTQGPDDRQEPHQPMKWEFPSPIKASNNNQLTTSFYLCWCCLSWIGISDLSLAYRCIVLLWLAGLLEVKALVWVNVPN